MAEQARRRTAGLDVEVVQADFLTAVRDGVLPRHSFSFVTSVAALHHMDPAAALEAMASLLEPGGRLAVAGLAMSRSAVDWLIAAAQIPDRAHHPARPRRQVRARRHADELRGDPDLGPGEAHGAGGAARGTLAPDAAAAVHDRVDGAGPGAADAVAGAFGDAARERSSVAGLTRTPTAGHRAMTAGERRAQILAVAAQEFALGGLHGTSTEAIARRAGITQAYVFRLFGSKKKLFIQVVRSAFEQLTGAMPDAAGDRTGLEALSAMDQTYDALLTDRTALLLQLQLRPRATATAAPS